MEVLRFRRTPWGQEVLDGVSWDLLWLFFAAGVAIIVAHMLYMRFLGAKRNRHGRTRPARG